MLCTINCTSMFPPSTLRQNQRHLTSKADLRQKQSWHGQPHPQTSSHLESTVRIRTAMFPCSLAILFQHLLMKPTPLFPLCPRVPGPTCPPHHILISIVTSVQSVFRFLTFEACHKENSERWNHLAGLRLQSRLSVGLSKSQVGVEKWRKSPDVLDATECFVFLISFTPTVLLCGRPSIISLLQTWKLRLRKFKKLPQITELITNFLHLFLTTLQEIWEREF